MENLITPTNKVNVTIRITQLSGNNNTFSFEHKTTAPANVANVESIAKKTAYYIANHVSELCAESLTYKMVYGKYPTAFRPKAAFQVEIVIDNTVKFVAMSTKGQDAIRLTSRIDGEDVVLSRGQIADKLLFMASIARVSNAAQTDLEFTDDVLSLMEA